MAFALARPFHTLHEIVPSMIGSIALQHCLLRGLIEYHFMVFEKRG